MTDQAGAVLLDVNVLVALAWPQHVHHEMATAWFDALGTRPWATCAVTESGFVRVSANRAAIPDAVTPAEALRVLDAIRAVPHHCFLADDVPAVVDEWVERALVVGHRQVTDAHLLALALRHDGSVATLDATLPRLCPAGHPAAVELLAS